MGAMCGRPLGDNEEEQIAVIARRRSGRPGTKHGMSHLSYNLSIEGYHNQVMIKMKILHNKIKILREKIEEFKE